MKAGTIRTSLDIPLDLHRLLHGVAMRRGCSARQLILGSIARVVAEDPGPKEKRVRLPLVPARGRRVTPATNDEALFP